MLPATSRQHGATGGGGARAKSSKAGRTVRGSKIGTAAVSWGQTQEQHRQSRPGSEDVTIQSMLSGQLGFWAPRRSQARKMANSAGPLSSCMMQGTGPTKKL